MASIMPLFRGSSSLNQLSIGDFDPMAATRDVAVRDCSSGVLWKSFTMSPLCLYSYSLGKGQGVTKGILHEPERTPFVLGCPQTRPGILADAVYGTIWWTRCPSSYLLTLGLRDPD
ncbi:hypothetical protein [Desulfomicrobium apsheronum]|uniref:hypothetical protein n=1 Tax=Desulfomicrobium apsheronum TaxID=52560 RepID=UPI0015A4FDBC|nr:hypothetical protein [Desulfomicrobium apsheronum]